MQNGVTRCGSNYVPGVYLCSECKSGYYSTSWNRSCSQCPGERDEDNQVTTELIIVLIVFSVLLALLSFAVILVNARVGGDWRRGLRRARRFIAYVISSLQIVAEISRQSTGYESVTVLKVYAWLNVFTTFDTKDALPPECWEDSNAVGPFFLSNCLMSVAIVVALVWLFLCFVLKNSISYCCCSQANNTNHGAHVFIKLQRILYSAMILVYPLICRTALMSVHCVQIEGSVKNIYILASKATVECFSEAHFFNGVLGSMALLFFCFGFPAAIFLLLSVSKIFDQSAMRGVEFTVQRSYTVESVDGFRRQPNDSNRGEWSENPMNTRNSNAAEGSARRSNRSSFDLNEDRAYASVLAFVRQEKNVLFAVQATSPW